MTPSDVRVHRPGLISRVVDPRRAEHVVALSAAVGALSLVDPASCGAAGRFALRTAVAALSGLAALAGVRATHPSALFAPVRWGVTAGAVGATYAMAEVGEALDAHLHRGLLRRGVRHPRIVLALVGAGLAVALSRVGAPADPPRLERFTDEHEDLTVDVPVEVRSLIEALLASTDDFGAPALRAQLAEARAVEYMGEDESAFYPGIGFEVPGELALAVPSEARFGVIGRYHPFAGRSADVYISVTQGRLANLTVAPGADWTLEDEVAWMDAGGTMQDVQRWPTPAEVTLLIDTPAGPQSLR